MRKNCLRRVNEIFCPQDDIFRFSLVQLATRRISHSKARKPSRLHLSPRLISQGSAGPSVRFSNFGSCSSPYPFRLQLIFNLNQDSWASSFCIGMNQYCVHVQLGLVRWSQSPEVVRPLAHTAYSDQNEEYLIYCNGQKSEHVVIEMTRQDKTSFHYAGLI